jgi:MFS family permease
MPESAGYINVIISVANLVFTTLASLFFDRFRHKSFLLASFSGMAIFSFLLSIGIFEKVSILSAVSCFMFVSSFSIGAGPLPWMVASKTVDYKAVDAAQSSGLVMNWVGTFIVGFLVPVIAAAVGMQWVFLGFGFIGVFTVLSVWYGVAAY